MVSWPTAEVLDTLRGEFPATILSRSRTCRLERLAAVLGRAAASYYCEFRFDDDPQVDFLALLRRRRNEPGRLCHAVAGDREQAWQRTIQFLEAWSHDALCAQIPFVWLEFDAVNQVDVGQLPKPNPAFGLEPGYWGRHIRAPVAAQPLWVRLVVRRALSLLATSTQEAALKCTDSILSALTPGGSLICITTMIARTPEAAKFYVSVPQAELCTFLERIGWPGNVRSVSDFSKQRFEPGANDVFIDLTVTEYGLQETLGIAWSQFQRGVPAHLDTSWSELLGQNICPLKLDVARRWSGIRETRISDVRTWVHRWLDLKAVLRPDPLGIQLKGYLGFMPSLPLPFS